MRTTPTNSDAFETSDDGETDKVTCADIATLLTLFVDGHVFSNCRLDGSTFTSATSTESTDTLETTQQTANSPTHFESFESCESLNSTTTANAPPASAAVERIIHSHYKKIKTRKGGPRSTAIDRKRPSLPKTAFRRFCEHYKRKNHLKAINAQTAQAWESLPDDQKKPYLDNYAAGLARYEVRMAEYRANCIKTESSSSSNVIVPDTFVHSESKSFRVPTILLNPLSQESSSKSPNPLVPVKPEHFALTNSVPTFPAAPTFNQTFAASTTLPPASMLFPSSYFPCPQQLDPLLQYSYVYPSYNDPVNSFALYNSMSHSEQYIDPNLLAPNSLFLVPQLFPEHNLMPSTITPSSFFHPSLSISSPQPAFSSYSLNSIPHPLLVQTPLSQTPLVRPFQKFQDLNYFDFIGDQSFSTDACVPGDSLMMDQMCTDVAVDSAEFVETLKQEMDAFEKLVKSETGFTEFLKA